MDSKFVNEADYDYLYDDMAEQSRVLHISIDKLMKIKDPEGSLYLWVPVRNTIHHLRRTTTGEIETQEDLLNSEEEFYTEEEIEDFIRGHKVDSNGNDEVGATIAENDNSMKMCNLNNGINTTNNAKATKSLSGTGSSTSCKRYFDDLDDCDIQGVLSEFDMPTMLGCIDGDNFLNEEDFEPLPKRRKFNM